MSHVFPMYHIISYFCFLKMMFSIPGVPFSLVLIQGMSIDFSNPTLEVTSSEEFSMAYVLFLLVEIMLYELVLLFHCAWWCWWGGEYKSE